MIYLITLPEHDPEHCGDDRSALDFDGNREWLSKSAPANALFHFYHLDQNDGYHIEGGEVVWPKVNHAIFTADAEIATLLAIKFGVTAKEMDDDIARNIIATHDSCALDFERIVGTGTARDLFPQNFYYNYEEEEHAEL